MRPSNGKERCPGSRRTALAASGATYSSSSSILSFHARAAAASAAPPRVTHLSAELIPGRAVPNRHRHLALGFGVLDGHKHQARGVLRRGGRGGGGRRRVIVGRGGGSGNRLAGACRSRSDMSALPTSAPCPGASPRGHGSWLPSPCCHFAVVWTVRSNAWCTPARLARCSDRLEGRASAGCATSARLSAIACYSGGSVPEEPRQV